MPLGERNKRGSCTYLIYISLNSKMTTWVTILDQPIFDGLKHSITVLCYSAVPLSADFQDSTAFDIIIVLAVDLSGRTAKSFCCWSFCAVVSTSLDLLKKFCRRSMFTWYLLRLFWPIALQRGTVRGISRRSAASLHGGHYFDTCQNVHCLRSFECATPWCSCTVKNQ